MMTISDLQYITQDNDIYSHAEQAKIMYSRGIKWVQIRMKDATAQEIKAESLKALAYAKLYNTKLIINDHIDIAQEIKASGVHLGLNDTPVSVARKILGNKFIIGATANTFNDIKFQKEQGANYIGLGPFRYTTTKKQLSPIIGLEGYKKIMQQVRKENINLPIIAVGGICIEDIEQIKKTGTNGVAISGDLLHKFMLIMSNQR
jgi:thiamine-phosphate pyrophosphorylase